MITIEQVIYVIPILGLTASVFYYAMVLRNQNRTRQAQLYMNLFQEISSQQWMMKHATLLNQEWENYEDFEKKYGSNEHPEHYAMRRSMWTQLDNIGAMLANKLLDPDMVYFLIQMRANMQWKKWERIIKEQRVRYTNPDDCKYFEYLVETMDRVRKTRGIEYETPDTFIRYIPDVKIQDN